MENDKEIEKSTDAEAPKDKKLIRDIVLKSIGEKPAPLETANVTPRIMDGIVRTNKISTPESQPVKEVAISAEKKEQAQQELDSLTTESAKESVPETANDPVTLPSPQAKKEEKAKPKKQAAKAKPKKAEAIPEAAPQLPQAKKKKSLPKLRLAPALSFLFLAFSFFILSYSILSFLVLEKGSDIPFLRFVASKIPIPAVYSQDGLLMYDDYRRLLEKYALKRPEGDAEKQLVRALLMERLFRSHGTRDLDRIEADLSSNTEANIVPYNRMKKLLSDIKDEGSFTRVAQRHGDVGQASLSPASAADYDFGTEAVSLEMNETSDLIITSKGYYIVHCYEKKGETLSLSYIFMPSVGLEDYLDDASAGYAYWLLAK